MNDKRLRYSQWFLSVALITGLIVGIMTSAHAVNQRDPVKLLQYIADRMIAGLKKNKATLKNKPGIVYNLAHKYVVPYADLDAMSKYVLPPTIWRNATPDQRTRFKKAFTRTLIRTYASALTSYDDQKVIFYPIRGGYQGVKMVQVHSQITGSNNRPINVTYRLIRSGGQWRLFDMSVEGVDMLESFRSQFASILSNGSMEHLLNRMTSHNAG